MRRLSFVICFLSIYYTLPAQSIETMAKASFEKVRPSYPLLKNAQIELKFVEKGSALSAAYTWWSIFKKPSKRKYFVRISKRVETKFICFQFDHLEPLSRDGVVAHEMAHIDYFHSLNFFGFFKFIVQQALPGGLRKSERATDYLTIKRGLGEELRAWSQETRDRFVESNHAEIPLKYSARYLTPEEIDSVMLIFPTMYKLH